MEDQRGQHWQQHGRFPPVQPFLRLCLGDTGSGEEVPTPSSVRKGGEDPLYCDHCTLQKAKVSSVCLVSVTWMIMEKSVLPALVEALMGEDWPTLTALFRMKGNQHFYCLNLGVAPQCPWKALVPSGTLRQSLVGDPQVMVGMSPKGIGHPGLSSFSFCSLAHGVNGLLHHELSP